MAMHKGWINHTPAEEMAGTLVRSSELTSAECGQTSIQTALHQDLFSLPFRPADRIVCALTAIQPEPQSAAALSFLLALGSHRSSQMLTIDDDSMIIYEPVPRTRDDSSTRKQLLLNAGDTIFYHPLLSHALPVFASGCSPASCVVSCHFASSECEYVIMSGHEALVPAHLKPISRIAVHPEVIHTRITLLNLLPFLSSAFPRSHCSLTSITSFNSFKTCSERGSACNISIYIMSLGFIAHPAINSPTFSLLPDSPFHQNKWKDKALLVKGKRITL